MYLESYKELIVWQKSISLVKEIYKITDNFPKSELYCLTSQMRRCAVSIPSNIAEGYKRKNIGEYVQFLSIADASAAELETQIIIAKELYTKIDFSIPFSLLDEVQKMLIVMIKKLNAKRYTLNANEGFTLIELIITIGITAILASVGFINLYGYFQRKNLDLAGQEVTAVLRNAQNNSISQEGGNRWGVHFENTTSSADSDFYELFSGANYSTSTVIQKVPLGSGINFSSPPAGDSVNVFFAPATGSTTSTVISIIGSSPGTVKDIVIKNNGGVVDNLEEGLVGYWHFDEGTGHATTTDASGYGNTGTLYSSPAWSSGSSCKSGGCISFNGSNNYTSMTDMSANGGVVSLEAWFYPTTTGGINRGIVAYLGRDSSPWIAAYFKVLSGNFDYFLGFANGTNTGNLVVQAVSPNTWYHGVLTYDGSVAKIYVNGALVRSDTYNKALSVISASSFIGKDRPSGGEYFQGFIDEVRIYNRALSATEVLKLYNDFK